MARLFALKRPWRRALRLPLGAPLFCWRADKAAATPTLLCLPAAVLAFCSQAVCCIGFLPGIGVDLQKLMGGTLPLHQAGEQGLAFCGARQFGRQRSEFGTALFHAASLADSNFPCARDIRGIAFFNPGFTIRRPSRDLTKTAMRRANSRAIEIHVCSSSPSRASRLQAFSLATADLPTQMPRAKTSEWRDVDVATFRNEIVPRDRPAILRGLVRDWALCAGGQQIAPGLPRLH